MLLSELVQAYLEEGLFRPATDYSYREKMRGLIRVVGDIDVRELTHSQLISWRNKMLGDGCSVETWNTRRRHLAAVFNWAVSRGHLAISPVHRVSQAPKQRRRKKTVTPMTLKAVVAHLDKLEADQSRVLFPQWFWRTMIQTFSWTGVRRSQLVALRWSDLDLDAGTLLLRADASKTHREHLVPIASALLPTLLDFRERMERLWHSGCGRQEDFPRSQLFNLLLAKSGWPSLVGLRIVQVSSTFARLGLATGTQFSPHRLRHTLATRLVQADVDLVHVQEMLGHADLRTTAGYVEPSMARLQAAVDRLASQ